MEKSGAIDTIRVRDLEKRYDSVFALRGVSFRIGQGEIVGFLGPNGAGKSTTLKILTGYLNPSAGNAWILGESVDQTGRSPRSRVGYLPERAPLYDDMTVAEYLRFVMHMRGVGRNESTQALKNALEKCGLSDVERTIIGTLSKGFRQRVGLAQAIIHNPEVLILDEPTSGLDPNQVDEMRALIKEFGRQKTVLFSSHVLGEVRAIAHRVLILNEGRLVADDTPAALGRQLIGNRVFLAVGLTSIDACREWLEHHEQVVSYQEDPSTVRGEFSIELRSDYEIADLAENVVKKGWPLLELRPARADLDMVFRQLTQEA